MQLPIYKAFIGVTTPFVARTCNIQSYSREKKHKQVLSLDF